MSGRSSGKVKDVWFDEFWRLSGVVLDTRVWLSKAVKAIKWDNIVSCGEDALLIRDSGAVETIDRNQLLRTFNGGVVRLKEMPVYTVAGIELGKVADVYFKDSEGTPLVGYELTDGFLADVFEGRRRLYLPDGPENVILGEDAILVPASCERVLERDHTRKVIGEDG
ncbi:photosystem reaction center subunit H [Cohnella faecalis]|uniref:Photosystem reaction center subunit H n=2 Tax=Cohnella faecalis TaxID=2315694 RepID=A0A398CPH8_9BACL|nr:photosystem reaction center subunit H [Cohnella faecalis]